MTRLLRTIVSLIVLVVTTQGASATQESLEQVILSRAVASIRNADPEWQFAAVAVNAGPIMDEQLGVAAGHWYKVGEARGGVIAWIYRLATEEAAERRVLQIPGAAESRVKNLTIQPYGLGDRATIQPYALGDRAMIVTYVNPRFTQYILLIRKGKFLVKLDSVSKEDIEQFAKILVAAISN
jgi:hypothetical protein